MAVISQDQWGGVWWHRRYIGGGIYRGRRSPGGSAYDAVNALVDDEGQLFRRAGSTYLSASNAAHALVGVYDAIVAAGQRTVMLSAQELFALDGSSNPVTVASLLGQPGVRPVGVGGWLVFPGYGPTWRVPVFYGGSLKASSYTTGTVGVTNGVATVSGVGTSWLANADAGMSIYVGAGPQPALGVVKSVDSDTTLTLRDPWGGTTAGVQPYALVPAAGFGSPSDTALGSIKVEYVAAVGTPPRLILTNGNRAYFTAAGNPFSINLATDFHELQQNARIIGADALGNSLILFTTAGVWAVSNMELDPVDDAGNVQQNVHPLSRSLILWGDAGVAAWEGNLIVPALDDVWLLGPNGPAETISGDILNEKIRPLYRGYVKSGYQPGLAAVHRGHYFLPILNGSTLVDVLVCRLDRGNVWTRFTGHAAGVAYAQRVGDTTRSPKLFGVNGLRVTDLSACLDPTGSASDADGTTPTFDVTTNDFELEAGVRPGTAEKVRVVYEAVGASPTVALSSAVGQEGTSFTAATLKKGGGASDGSSYSVWRVGRKGTRVRFRFVCSSPVTQLILRSLEITVRPAA